MVGMTFAFYLSVVIGRLMIQLGIFSGLIEVRSAPSKLGELLLKDVTINSFNGSILKIRPQKTFFGLHAKDLNLDLHR